MKIPKARKLSSGMWFIQLRLDGESVPITASKESECEKQARYIKASHEIGKREKKASGANMTLLQAINAYIDSRDNALSPSTVRGYDAIRDNRFQGVIDKKLDEIKDWQSVCNIEAKICSAKTLKNAWGLIGSVLRYAGYVVPTVTLPQVVDFDGPWLEPNQIQIFIDAIKGDSCEIEMLLALHGLRRSEVKAVDKDKIDLSKDLITVRGAVVQNRKHKFVKKDTNKNRKSRRVIPIMIPRFAVLLANAEKDDKKIFRYRPQTVCNHVNRICKKIGLPEVGLQGLRRSFASLCYHLGLSERETMDLGGWADANTMRKIYIKLAQEDKAKACNKLIEFFKNPKIEE